MPQGGILSPLLCNIVLHQYDLFMDKTNKNLRKGEQRKDSAFAYKS